MAFFLAALIFCSQAVGQTLSTAPSLPTPDTLPVDTLVVAQNDSASSSPGWLSEIDIDPPVIDHEALESGVSGQTQDFSAVIVDDRGLEHVLLFYRDRSGAQYNSVEMQRSEGTDNYQVSVDTSLGQTRVEYYIEALDTGGNRVLKGFPFFPLVRELTPATANAGQNSGQNSGQNAGQEPGANTSDNRLIYVLLGVAAVGLVVALSGGSDDGGSGGNGGGAETPDTVPLNIIVTPP